MEVESPMYDDVSRSGYLSTVLYSVTMRPCHIIMFSRTKNDSQHTVKIKMVVKVFNTLALTMDETKPVLKCRFRRLHVNFPDSKRGSAVNTIQM